MSDFRKVQEFAAKKYSLAILRGLLAAQEGTGFNALLKSIPGITPRILSTRLKELERLKLVQKNLVLGQPTTTSPRIEYRATPKAAGLKKALSELEKWASKEL